MTDQQDSDESLWYVYVLLNRQTGAVYTGATNNPKRRLRAHNGEIAGGARTTAKWGKGKAVMSVLVGPFPSPMSKNAALSFEKKMKVSASPFSKTKGRLCTLHRLLWSPGGQVTKKLRLRETIVVNMMFSKEFYLKLVANKKNKKPTLPTIAVFNFLCADVTEHAL